MYSSDGKNFRILDFVLNFHVNKLKSIVIKALNSLNEIMANVIVSLK